ncbi:MAG: hypothetical protein LLG20_12890 [Acidobacteriales bacterium]|nr:hypothetical protein [Terriglobales bacterium]
MLEPDQPLLEDQIDEWNEEEHEFVSLVDQAIKAGTVKGRPREAVIPQDRSEA